MVRRKIKIQGKKECEEKRWSKRWHHCSDLLLAKMTSNDNRNRVQREAMIDTINKPQARRMGKLVDFFLNSRTKLPTTTIKLLSKNQEFLKGVTEYKVPISMKKRIFEQKGGILPMLLPFAAKDTAPLAGSLLSGIAGKLL